MPKEKKPKPILYPEIIEAKKLSPVISVPTNLHQEANMDFQPKDGLYHIRALDANGNEIEGSDFSISQRGYKKFYSDETKFIVKKNPNL